MSNLLEKASIITTPTAYEDGKLLSVKPVQSLSSELVTNGGFDTDSDWTKQTGWSISGGKAIAENAASGKKITGLFSPTANKKYRVKFEITEITQGAFRGYLGGAISDDFNSVGTYTFDLIPSSTGNIYIRAVGTTSGSIDNVSVKEVIDADFNFERGSSATRINAQGLIEDVTGTNTPRIDYLGGTGSILLEPASTNRTLNSEQPSTWHSSNNMTITADATTSPDGTSNASLAVISGTSGGIYTRNLFQFTTGTGTQTVTGSYFVKYYNNQWIRIRTSFFSGSPANGKNSFFDIQNGVLGTVDATHTSKIEDYGNGWYRCSVTFDIDKDSDVNGYLQLEAMSSDDTNTYPSIGQGYYAFGSQGEELSYPTSYIPTTASYGSRNADLCNNAGSSDLINSTEGVLYAEIKALSNDATRRDITISNGTTSNRVMLRYDNASNRVQAFIQVGGATNGNMNSIAYTITNFLKIAYKWKAGDFALWINGTEVGTSTDATSFSADTLTEVNFDRGENNAEFFYGNVKCVAVFQEALTDTELTCLTTI